MSSLKISAKSRAGCLIVAGTLLWVIGLLLFGENCSELNRFGDIISGYIPAIHSYSVAAKYSCEAKAFWAFSWAASPLAVLFVIWMSTPVMAERLRIRHAVLIFSLFVIFAWVCFVGVYDPYPGTDKGRWASIYRESREGLIVVTFILWFSLLASLYVLVSWVKSYFIHRNNGE